MIRALYIRPEQETEVVDLPENPVEARVLGESLVGGPMFRVVASVDVHGRVYHVPLYTCETNTSGPYIALVWALEWPEHLLGDEADVVRRFSLAGRREAEVEVARWWPIPA